MDQPSPDAEVAGGMFFRSRWIPAQNTYREVSVPRLEKSPYVVELPIEIDPIEPIDNSRGVRPITAGRRSFRPAAILGTHAGLARPGRTCGRPVRPAAKKIAGPHTPGKSLLFPNPSRRPDLPTTCGGGPCLPPRLSPGLPNWKSFIARAHTSWAAHPAGASGLRGRHGTDSHHHAAAGRSSAGHDAYKMLYLVIFSALAARFLRPDHPRQRAGDAQRAHPAPGCCSPRSPAPVTPAT